MVPKSSNGYSYSSPEHRRWSKNIRDSANGCAVPGCTRGRVGPRGGKRGRLHAHHVLGHDSQLGIALCPSHHKLIELLYGPCKDFVNNPAAAKFIRKLVRLKTEANESVRN